MADYKNIPGVYDDRNAPEAEVKFNYNDNYKATRTFFTEAIRHSFNLDGNFTPDIEAYDEFMELVKPMGLKSSRNVKNLLKGEAHKNEEQNSNYEKRINLGNLLVKLDSLKIRAKKFDSFFMKMNETEINLTEERIQEIEKKIAQLESSDYEDKAWEKDATKITDEELQYMNMKYMFEKGLSVGVKSSPNKLNVETVRDDNGNPKAFISSTVKENGKFNSKDADAIIALAESAGLTKLNITGSPKERTEIYKAIEKRNKKAEFEYKKRKAEFDARKAAGLLEKNSIFEPQTAPVIKITNTDGWAPNRAHLDHKSIMKIKKQKGKLTREFNKQMKNLKKDLAKEIKEAAKDDLKTAKSEAKIIEADIDIENAKSFAETLDAQGKVEKEISKQKVEHAKQNRAQTGKGFIAKIKEAKENTKKEKNKTKDAKSELALAKKPTIKP